MLYMQDIVLKSNYSMSLDAFIMMKNIINVATKCNNKEQIYNYVMNRIQDKYGLIEKPTYMEEKNNVEDN